MKRYALFAGQEYACRGGWSDFCGSFDTADEAAGRVRQFVAEDVDWFHVVDLESGVVVAAEPDGPPVV